MHEKEILLDVIEATYNASQEIKSWGASYGDIENQLESCIELSRENIGATGFLFPPIRRMDIGNKRIYLSKHILDSCGIIKCLFYLYGKRSYAVGFVAHNLIRGATPYTRYMNRSGSSAILPGTIHEYLMSGIMDELHRNLAKKDDIRYEINAHPGKWMQIEGHRNVVIGASVCDETLNIYVCTTGRSVYPCHYPDDLILCCGGYHTIYEDTYSEKGNISLSRRFSLPSGSESKTFNSEYDYHSNWLYKQREYYNL